MHITTTDYHTAGEPFRIVTDGVDVPAGDTVAARRRFAVDHLDDVRALLCREPRGHADMYGCFVTPPDDDGAVLGTVFFHNDGFSTACGHGTIALVTWAIDTGLVVAHEGDVEVAVDVPSGRVETVASVHEGRVRHVRFRNVPAYVHASGVMLHLGDTAAPHRRRADLPDQVTVDVAYGGAFYATVPAADVGCRVSVADLPTLIAAGRAIQTAADAALDLRLPDASGASGLYGVVFHEPLGQDHQRNVTVFADGQVDRSPCGSGTSARLATLAERGELTLHRPFRHDSIVGTTFDAQLTGVRTADGRQLWDTEVIGRSSRTGEHTFVLEDDDEVGLGFVLR